VPARPKVLEFDVSVDHAGDAHSALGGDPVPRRVEWWSEHLVLAGLVRCTLASLDFFAKQQSIEASGTGSAEGVVTKRDEDGRYAFVEIECGLDVELEPKPEDEVLKELLERAEWGCFIGASLTVKPRYEWRVNGVVA
jgi:organic hydroperoxide reductase OsmC/OhrA